jgi:hypothetical protein
MSRDRGVGRDEGKNDAIRINVARKRRGKGRNICKRT